ncbi:MAG: DsrE family protein [Xenococcaceae cyanobacterium]
MKALQVIECAYRCTIEEQDDPSVWISQAMKAAGADLDILLRGNAVNYAVSGQDASGLAFGDKKQTQPPRLDQDLLSAREKGINIYVLTEDAQSRGISEAKMIGGVKKVSRQELPELFGKYDQIWHW